MDWPRAAGAVVKAAAGAVAAAALGQTTALVVAAVAQATAEAMAAARRGASGHVGAFSTRQEPHAEVSLATNAGAGAYGCCQCSPVFRRSPEREEPRGMADALVVRK